MLRREWGAPFKQLSEKPLLLFMAYHHEAGLDDCWYLKLEELVRGLAGEDSLQITFSVDFGPVAYNHSVVVWARMGKRLVDLATRVVFYVAPTGFFCFS